MGLKASSDLTLLLKYLSGRLPASDFEIDFGNKGTALNMLNALFTSLGESINDTARPIDAIKHQAKTVTVGTSRISEKVEGLIFDALVSLGFSPSQLIPSNIVVLKNLQNVVSQINGMILYKIGGLNILGEPNEESTIRVVRKMGILQNIPSRVEENIQLSGSKRIVVRQGNVYVGKGLRDDRSIILIPFISESPSAPNIIEHLLLLNIGIRQDIPLKMKIKALGGKYEHIKSIVQENSIKWEDRLLEIIKVQNLFGRSAEKIGESIVSMQQRKLHLIRKGAKKLSGIDERRYRAIV
jgi:glutamine---fructose-6-phosphate transaminase (isomerizing)